MADESNVEEEPVEVPGRSAPKILVILVGLNLLVTGGVAFKVFTTNGLDSAIMVKNTDGEEDSEAERESGPVHELESFVVNLNEPGSSRYLKTTFNLELEDKEAIMALEKNILAVRDQVLRYLSSLTVKDTLSADGKDTIQEGIIAKVDVALGGGRVRGLFFTEFVVQ